MYTEYVIINFVLSPSWTYDLMTRELNSRPRRIDEPVEDWFWETIMTERSGRRFGNVEQYVQYLIYDEDESLFLLDGVQYAYAYFIWGMVDYYWIFYKDEPVHTRVFGSAPLDYAICGCCIYLHIPIVVSKIQKLVEKKEYIPEQIMERKES